MPIGFEEAMQTRIVEFEKTNPERARKLRVALAALQRAKLELVQIGERDELVWDRVRPWGALR